MFSNSKFKIFEFCFIFLLLPILFFIKIIPVHYIIPILWIISFYSFFVLRKECDVKLFEKINLNDLKYILIRFILISIIMVLFTYIFFEEYFFRFAIEKSKLYFFVMIFYPILSVIPQEFIFRKFFFKRYSFYFSSNKFLFLNSACFSWAHIIFNNYLAVVFTFIGGYLFVQTYKRTNSFSLVCIEHILYGNLLFTIGLGNFFYHDGIISFLNII